MAYVRRCMALSCDCLALRCGALSPATRNGTSSGTSCGDHYEQLSADEHSIHAGGMAPRRHVWLVNDDIGTQARKGTIRLRGDPADRAD